VRVEVPEWVIRKFRKYPTAQFCLNCGEFVGNAYEHEKMGHIVVERVRMAYSGDPLIRLLFS